MDCIRKFNARRKMKAAMTAVFAANQVNRKVSGPARSKSDTTCSGKGCLLFARNLSYRKITLFFI